LGTPPYPQIGANTVINLAFVSGWVQRDLASYA